MCGLLMPSQIQVFENPVFEYFILVPTHFI